MGQLGFCSTECNGRNFGQCTSGGSGCVCCLPVDSTRLAPRQCSGDGECNNDGGSTTAVVAVTPVPGPTICRHWCLNTVTRNYYCCDDEPSTTIVIHPVEGDGGLSSHTDNRNPVGQNQDAEEEFPTCVVTCDYRSCLVPGVGFCLNGNPCCTVGLGADGRSGGGDGSPNSREGDGGLSSHTDNRNPVGQNQDAEEEFPTCVVTCDYSSCLIPGVGFCLNGNPCCTVGLGADGRPGGGDGSPNYRVATQSAQQCSGPCGLDGGLGICTTPTRCLWVVSGVCGDGCVCCRSPSDVFRSLILE